jgi:DNA polymerase (family 10)
MNTELSRVFERIADLLEISGADRFRINSYRKVSRTLDDLTDDIADVASRGELAKLPGVGKGTAEKITQYLQTGSIPLLVELEAKLPEGLPDLLGIPGMGPKRVALVHNELKVGGIEDLKRVIASGKLAALAGFGEQSVKKIAEGLEFLEKSGGRTPLGLALPIARGLMDRVSAISGVRRVSPAGSLRRGVETIGDVDILCEADNGEDVVQAFVSGPEVHRVLAAGPTKGSVTVELPTRRELQADLRVVPAESFGAALQYFTGSKAHNIRLREMAVKRKWRLNEWGLFDGKRQIAGATEEQVYAKLGWPCFPPELREDRGEFDDPECVDALVTREDIRGDLHVHTTASDGVCSIEEIAQAAKKLGYRYLAICDHSKSSVIANGLSIERMKRHIKDIRAADKKMEGFSILVGCECDILSDGSLDYPDEILRECDLVVASIHSGMTGSKTSPTERTLAAMRNPYVTIIGHPTGRLINQRPPMKIDIPAVIEAAAKTHTALELNSSWQRLDLKDVHVHQAIDAGVAVAICTDAHSGPGLRDISYGVATARRGAARRDAILNTRTVTDLRRWIARKRNRQ